MLFCTYVFQENIVPNIYMIFSQARRDTAVTVSLFWGRKCRNAARLDECASSAFFGVRQTQTEDKEEHGGFDLRFDQAEVELYQSKCKHVFLALHQDVHDI